MSGVSQRRQILWFKDISKDSGALGSLLLLTLWAASEDGCCQMQFRLHVFCFTSSSLHPSPEIPLSTILSEGP